MADARIHIGIVARELANARAANYYPGLYKYLNGATKTDGSRELVQPQMPSAYQLGEALRRAGIGWMSGFLMVYIAGHFADAIGILWVFLRAQFSKDIPFENVDGIWAVWQLFVLCRRLCWATVYDEDPEIVGLRINHGVGIIENVHAYMSIDRRFGSIRNLGVDDRALSFEQFIYREHAKRDLLNLVLPILNSEHLNDAFNTWCTEKLLHAPNYVLSDAYHLARLRLMKLELQEDSLQRLVTYWFIRQLESKTNLDIEELRIRFALDETEPELDSDLDDIRREYLRELFE